MPTLAEFTAFVTDMEKGSYPVCFKDRSEAAKQLVGDICTASWETAELREEAQGLVAKLERLRRGGIDTTQINEPNAMDGIP